MSEVPTIQVERPASLPRGAAGLIHAALAQLAGVTVEAVRMAPASDAVVARTTATPAQLAEVVAAVAEDAVEPLLRQAHIHQAIVAAGKQIRQKPKAQRTPEERRWLLLAAYVLGEAVDDPADS